MAVDPLGTLPLFKIPKGGKKSATRQKAASKPEPSYPKWSRYRPKFPLRCDDCQDALAAAYQRGEPAPIARKAAFKRTDKRGFRLLCGGHAQEWRTRDKLPKFRRVA